MSEAVAQEMNFDGIVGPTHNYAGLSYGNLASLAHKHQVSSPRGAALQGLAKAKALADRGLRQGVLPPLMRPDFSLAREMGYTGSDEAIVRRLGADDPVLLAVCYSVSSMWTANAGTVSPSIDTADGKLHFTTANLMSQLHRSIEAKGTSRVMRQIFGDEKYFAVHDALHGAASLCDEGAANHTRFCKSYGGVGIESFVYGRSFLEAGGVGPKRYPARQSLESVKAITRRHGLRDDRVVLMQQNPEVIDEGVFHNDVISVGNLNVLLYHERAFLGGDEKVTELKARYEAVVGGVFYAIKIADEVMSVGDAVESYLFNSQLVDLGDGKMGLVCPARCKGNEGAMGAIDFILGGDNPVDEVMFFDLHESMNNGGGPACLRLRVVMNEAELGAMHQGVVLTDSLYERLVVWVKEYYREELRVEDLRDVGLMGEVREGLMGLSDILELPNLYLD